MTRPLPQPAGQTRGFAVRARRWASACAMLALAACATGSDPAVTPPGPTFAAPRATTPARPPADPIAPRPTGPGPIAPGQVFTAPAPGEATRDRAGLAAACRQDADRIVVYRDRGQLMREDERDARIGTDSSIYARRGESDRLGRIFERDRIAADCVQQNTRSAPQR